MHIHGNSMSIQSASLYAAPSESAAAAQRAAEVRKRLLKSAQSIEAGADPARLFLSASGSTPATARSCRKTSTTPPQPAKTPTSADRSSFFSDP